MVEEARPATGALSGNRPESGFAAQPAPADEALRHTLPDAAGDDGLDALREAALRACLDEFPHVQLTVTGDCMAPALRHGQVVLLARPQTVPTVGMIVLARHAAGLRLHRLVWGPPFTARGANMRTKGDRSPSFDAALPPGAIWGVVIGVEGGGPSPGRRWRTRTLRSLGGGLRTWVRARIFSWLGRRDAVPGRAV